MARFKSLSYSLIAFVSLAIRLLFGKNIRNSLFEKLKWYDKGRAVILGIFYPVCILTKNNKFFQFLPHEKEVAKFLFRLKGSVFIDVGANLGFYSALLCRNFRVIAAVEPHPEDMKVLKSNLKRITNNIVFVQKAVSDKNGLAHFSFSGRSLSGTGREQFLICTDEQWRKKHWQAGGTAEIETITIESLIEDLMKINSVFENVDLIKVDVEGAEWEVLSGAKRAMKKIRAWLIELHNLSRKNEMNNLLNSFGYKPRWIDNNHVFAWRE